jgi:hypothetical protein
LILIAAKPVDAVTNVPCERNTELIKYCNKNDLPVPAHPVNNTLVPSRYQHMIPINHCSINGVNVDALPQAQRRAFA